MDASPSINDGTAIATLPSSSSAPDFHALAEKQHDQKQTSLDQKQHDQKQIDQKQISDQKQITSADQNGATEAEPSAAAVEESGYADGDSKGGESAEEKEENHPGRVDEEDGRLGWSWSVPVQRRVVPAPYCGERLTCFWILLAVVGSWFLMILSISCTPWDYLGPMLVSSAAILLIMLGLFVPITHRTTGLFFLCCCNAAVPPASRHPRATSRHGVGPRMGGRVGFLGGGGGGGVCEDLHPLTRSLLATVFVAASVIIGYLVSRETLPDVTVSDLEVSTTDSSEWMVSGLINVPWCPNNVRVQKGSNTLFTFPFDVERDGTFSGEFAPASSNMSSLVSGLTVSCGACWSTANVRQFFLQAPGWNGTATFIPFFDIDRLGTYFYATLSVVALALELHAVHCIHANAPFFAKPLFCHQK